MRRGLASVAALAVALPLAASETLTVPYEQFTLPNGLNVILHEDHTTPTVSVNVWYHVGSGREKPGRTGFAHLFEHILFEGSEHVPEGMFDRWLEAAGGVNNGSTNADRTNYWENVPSNAVELALFLESDRMGYLLGAMSPEKVDGQRDIVKNERRQSYENRPYGLAFQTLGENLFPPDHRYHWPTIGSMEDLSAASYEDVVEFFETYYSPANASLVIAGDIDPAATRSMVEHWFSDVPSRGAPPPLAVPLSHLSEEKRVVLEDDVQLPRLYICWISPAHFAPGDAEMDLISSVLASGKTSRLYQRLVYDLQIAQDVNAFQWSRSYTGVFCVTSTAREERSLAELEAVIQDELDRLKAEPAADREVQRSKNQIESAFLRSLEQVGGFGGKADRLNSYYFATGNPDWFEEDRQRYRSVTGTDLMAIARHWLRDDGRVVLSIVPSGKPELAAHSPDSGAAEGGDS